MADEIEYLKEKFRNGVPDSENSSSSKIMLYTQFTEIKGLIDEKLASPVPEAGLEKARAILHELNNILAECQMQSRASKLTKLQDPLFSNRTRKELKTKTDTLKEWNLRAGGAPAAYAPAAAPAAATADSTTVSSQPEKKQESFKCTTKSVNEKKVHGFVDELMLLEKMIVQEGTPDPFKAIGIVGDTGSGKTTLAKMILTSNDVRKNFVPRIWVCMSKHHGDDGEDSKKEILKRMLDSLGVEDDVVNLAERKGIAGLLFALQLQLKGKRYLVVLDGVWNNDPWYQDLGKWVTDVDKWGNKLAYGFPKGRGGTVIVTSSDEEIAKKMVGDVCEENIDEKIFRVQPLSNPDDVWKIFLETARKDEAKFQELKLEHLRKDVLDKCRGLPLATVLMGESMHQQMVKNHEEEQKALAEAEAKAEAEDEAKAAETAQALVQAPAPAIETAQASVQATATETAQAFVQTPAPETEQDPVHTQNEDEDEDEDGIDGTPPPLPEKAENITNDVTENEDEDGIDGTPPPLPKEAEDITNNVTEDGDEDGIDGTPPPLPEKAENITNDVTENEDEDSIDGTPPPLPKEAEDITNNVTEDGAKDGIDGIPPPLPEKAENITNDVTENEDEDGIDGTAPPLPKEAEDITNNVTEDEDEDGIVVIRHRYPKNAAEEITNNVADNAPSSLEEEAETSSPTHTTKKHSAASPAQHKIDINDEIHHNGTK